MLKGNLLVLFCSLTANLILMGAMEGNKGEIYLSKAVWVHILSFIHQKNDLHSIHAVSKEFQKIVEDLMAYHKELNRRKTRLYNEKFAAILAAIKNENLQRKGVKQHFCSDEQHLIVRDNSKAWIIKTSDPNQVQQVGQSYFAVINHSLSAYLHVTDSLHHEIINIPEGKFVGIDYDAQYSRSQKFSFDDSLLAYIRDHDILLYDVRIGKINAQVMCGMRHLFSHVAAKFHPVKPLLLATTECESQQTGITKANSCLFAWDLRKLKPVQQWQESEEVYNGSKKSFCISPDDAQCAVLLDDKIYQWQIQPGECPRLPMIQLEGDVGNRMRYSADGSKLFIKRERRFIGQSSSLIVYDLNFQRQLDLTSNPYIPGLCAFNQFQKVSPSGRYGVTGSHLYYLKELKALDDSIDMMQ